MKTNSILIFLGLMSLSVYSQDIIYKRNNDSISCKVIEIGLNEIKYKLPDNIEGPNYVIAKSEVKKIVYANGKEEFYRPDEMAANKDLSVINKRQAIKFGIFSPINSHLELSYEKVLKVGMNICASVGWIDNNFNAVNNSNSGQKFSGLYFQGGLKFLMGQDFYLEGMKYTHPLRGTYIKLEGTYSHFVDKDITVGYYTTQSSNSNYFNFNSYYYYPSNNIDIKEDIYHSTLAFNLVIGKQVILGQILILDFYLGVGYGYKFNSDFAKNNGSNYYYYFNEDASNYFSHVFLGNSSVCLTGGVALGAIF